MLSISTGVRFVQPPQLADAVVEAAEARGVLARRAGARERSVAEDEVESSDALLDTTAQLAFDVEDGVHIIEQPELELVVVRRVGGERRRGVHLR